MKSLKTNLLRAFRILGFIKGTNTVFLRFRLELKMPSYTIGCKVKMKLTYIEKIVNLLT
jgi:hypothetical protein